MHRVWSFVSEYSLLLIMGALTALVWVNVDPHGYHHFVHFNVWENQWIGHLHHGADGHTSRSLTLHYLFNDVAMAFFFAIAGKEVWEAVALKNGSLRGKKALTPLIATSGGMFGPIAVYLGLATLMGSETYNAVANGWAIPTATDIAFSYLVGRMVFGAGHPAVRFLLLLAIADDAAGLVILAIFYPSGDVQPLFLLGSLAAAVGVWFLFNYLPRRMDRHKQDRPNSTWVREKLHFWPYLIAGIISWLCFQEAGLHPALGLLPIVPAIPHAEVSFGIFAAAEKHLTDLLNDIEHKLKAPVEFILFFFALANAGVELNSVGHATWLVLAGLLIGKPIGIFIMGWLAAVPMRLGLPDGMRLADLFVLGCVAAIGFTVSLFVASVAFKVDPTATAALQAHQQLVQDGAKMGALLSFFAAVMSFAASVMCRVKKQH